MHMHHNVHQYCHGQLLERQEDLETHSCSNKKLMVPHPTPPPEGKARAIATAAKHIQSIVEGQQGNSVLELYMLSPVRVLAPNSACNCTLRAHLPVHCIP